MYASRFIIYFTTIQCHPANPPYNWVLQCQTIWPSVRFDSFMTMTRQIIIFCDMTPYSLVDGYQNFKGTSYLHLQGRRWKQQVPSKNRWRIPDYTTSHPRRLIFNFIFSFFFPLYHHRQRIMTKSDRRTKCFVIQIVHFFFSLTNHCADPLPWSLWWQSFQNKLWYKVSPSWNFNLLLLFVNLNIPLLIWNKNCIRCSKAKIPVQAIFLFTIYWISFGVLKFYHDAHSPCFLYSCK